MRYYGRKGASFQLAQFFNASAPTLVVFQVKVSDFRVSLEPDLPHRLYPVAALTWTVLGGGFLLSTSSVNILLSAFRVLHCVVNSHLLKPHFLLFVLLWVYIIFSSFPVIFLCHHLVSSWAQRLCS